MRPDPHTELAKLGANFVALRAGEVVEATVTPASARQVARLLEVAPSLATLRLNFVGGIKPAAVKTLFDVPGLRRLDEIEVSGGPARGVWEAFFGSPHVRELKRVEVGGEHAVAFSRAPWPRLEALRIGVDGSAADRKALTRIVAAELPRLRALALRTYKFGAAGAEVIARSPVYPQLRDLEIYDLEPALGDDGIAALATRGQRLARLQLSLESLTTKGITALARLSSGLQRLEITGCPVDDERLRRLAKVEHVRVLKFLATPSPGALGTLLAATPELEELVLRQTATAGHCEAIASASLSRLRSLRITESPIGVAGATALATLANLELLDLRSSEIGDGGALALPRLRRLRELELQFCGIGSAGGAALAAWPRDGVLTTLNLNGNHILDKTVQDALTTRFDSMHRVTLLGYQHPICVEPVVAEPVIPKQRRQPPLPPRRRDWSAGLRELVGRKHFASWDGYVDAKVIARSEALIDRTAEAILALGAEAEAKAQRAVLKKCVMSFNKLADHIFTIEAENIVETFEAIARYTKLAKEEDLADEWRDF